MINTTPQASNNVYGRDKCFKYINRTVRIVQWQQGPVVWEMTSRSVGSNLGVVYLMRFLYTFFSDIFLPFGLFPCILIADPLQFRETFCDNVFLV